VFHLIQPEDDEEGSEPTSPTASLEMLAGFESEPAKPQWKSEREPREKPDAATTRGAQRCASTS
jgi:hypothetical protein